ncbi:hypothetical protein Tco_1326829 [Tanacetum coccineum]
MSDSDESGITYTAVSSPYEDLSDIGSPRADDHEFLELPYMLEDPYLEAALQAPPSPDYVPGSEEPEQAPPSPDYVPETNPEADPEEDDDEDPKEDPIDYLADGGDDGDDEMHIEEDEDDDMDIEADKEDEDDEMDVEVDEEEHPAPAYPVVVALPATAPSAEETEPFETDESAATPPPHPTYRMTARITIPEPVPVPAWSDSEVARLLAISSPPASPLSPCYFPFSTISTPSFLYSLPDLDATSSLAHIQLLLHYTHHIYEVGESSASAAARPDGGIREDYGFVATMDREIKHDPERYVGYGIRVSCQDQEELQSADRSRQSVITDFAREDSGGSEELTDVFGGQADHAR